MPGRGDIGCKSMATILTSFRGLSSDCKICGSCSCEGALGDCDGGNMFCIACRCFSALSSHAERPNFSPLINTLDSTCDQEPGAAHKSTTRVTSLNKSNSVNQLLA